MDIDRVLAQLREELDNIDAAIISLERLQQGGRRRGRPPAWLAEPKAQPRTEGPAAAGRDRKFGTRPVPSG